MIVHRACRSRSNGSSVRAVALTVSLVFVCVSSVALAAPPAVAAVELAPTTTTVSVTPNPTPQGESTYVSAHVTPAPIGIAWVEFVYASAAGRSWSDVARVNEAGDASGRPLLEVDTYDVTAFFLGNDDLAPSTSSTQAFAVVERIVAIPRFLLEYSTIYADQTVPFTMWAHPTPLTGDLRLNASTWVKSGDFPVTAGDAHGTLDFDYGNYDDGAYHVYAELRRSTSAAKGCPIDIKPKLRPDVPLLEVSPASVPAGSPLTFDLSVFDPSALPGIYGFLSADLHFRFEDGREEISRSVDISSGSGSTVWSLPRPGTYDVWFTLADYIWAAPESNHVSVTVLPFFDQPFPPLRATQPGAQPTTITLDPLPSTGWKSDPIPFRATISPAPSSGSVRIEDGSSSFALLSPTGTPGMYAATGYSLSAGPHRFRAVYDGNASFAPSASEAQDVVADSIPTTTQLTFTPDSPDALTDVTVTATVSPVPPSGTIYVYRDGTLELTGQVNRTTGKASWTSTWPTWAIHHLTARFEYGGRFADSHSDTVTLAVSTVRTGVTLSGPATIANAGVSTSFTAAFERAPVQYAGLALFVDDKKVNQWSITKGPRVVSTSFRPGQHKVQVQYWPQPGVEGWSDPLIVNVGPYANRALIQGTLVVNHGNPFTNSEIVLIEPSLVTGSAYATSLQLSNDGVHWATFTYVNGFNNSLLWDLSNAACGGSSAPGNHRIYYRWTNYQGSNGVPIESVDVTITDSDSAPLAIDRIAPTPTVPTTGSSLSAVAAGAVSPTTVRWTGTDNLSGIGQYELEQSVNGGQWIPVELASPTDASVGLNLTAGTSYQFRVRARDRAGNLSSWSTSDAFVPQAPPDVTPPTVFAPVVAIPGGTVLAAKPAVTVSWRAGTDDSGLAAYGLEAKSSVGSWTPVQLSGPLVTSVNLGLAVGANYQFRLRATDVAGNTSAYTNGASFKLTRLQENAVAIKYVGAWSRVTQSGASGSYVKKASVSGARATYAFTGRWVAIASTLGPNRGKVRVTLDGAVTTIDLYSATTKAGWVVFSRGVPMGPHTLVIEATGLKNASSSGSRVDLDALITLQ
jgi:hypothetical protein